MATQWQHEDELKTHASIGEARGQARWEAYAAVAALITWKDLAFTSLGGIALIGDALGVLFGSAMLKNKDRIINNIMQDLALVVAPPGQHIDCIHVWSEQNELTDYLSSMTDNSDLPHAVRDAPRTEWADSVAWRLL